MQGMASNMSFLGKPCVFLLLIVGIVLNTHAEVEVKGNWIYIDGDKFLVRGIGYSPFRTVSDYKSVPSWLVEEDFQRIRAAGFNTILTWDVIPARVIELARIYNLKIIMGIWVTPSGPFDDETILQKAIDKINTDIGNTKEYENIIAYIIAGEPQPKSILAAGLSNTVEFYKSLAAAMRKAAPDLPAGMMNWIKSSWLDMSDFDIVCYNLYGHDFDNTRANIGISNYISWLRSRGDIKSKPFLVTEFGYSVSPQGEGNYGYGGNTLEEQALGNVTLYREIMQSGAAGACVFEWNDEWWKAGQPFKHDLTTEEWFGIIGIEDRDDPVGEPRPAYYALQNAFKITVIKPQNMSQVSGLIDFEVNSILSVTEVKYRVNGGPWIQLSQEKNWWYGKWNSEKAGDGKKLIEICGKESEAETEIQRFYIWAYNEKSVPPEPLTINVSTDRNNYSVGDKLLLNVELIDGKGYALNGHQLDIAYEYPENWNLDYWKCRTDQSGTLVQEILLKGIGNGYHTIFVTTSYEIDDLSKQFARVLQIWVSKNR